MLWNTEGVSTDGILGGKCCIYSKTTKNKQYLLLPLPSSSILALKLGRDHTTEHKNQPPRFRYSSFSSLAQRRYLALGISLKGS